MKKAIYATLFHVASSKTQEWHNHCPDGASSWCQFKQDEATGGDSYKPSTGLPKEIIKEVKPIFHELSQDYLLKRCLHGRTQNANECLTQLFGSVYQNPFMWHFQLSSLVFMMLLHILTFELKPLCLFLNSWEWFRVNTWRKGSDTRNRKRLYVASEKSSETTKKRRKLHIMTVFTTFNFHYCFFI